MDDYTQNIFTSGLVGIGAAQMGSGVLDFRGDVDWLKISLLAGKAYEIELGGSLIFKSGYEMLSLYDANGRVLASQFDRSYLDGPLIRYIPDVSGDYYLEVRDLFGETTGGYTVGAKELASNDIVKPTIALSASDISLTYGEVSNITITLSEPSVNFDWDDIVVSGGVLSNFTGSGSSYAVTYTPFPNSTTAGRISVASGRFSDAAGNLNADGSDANNAINFSINTVPLDNVLPTISLSASDTNLTYGEVSNITIVLSEPSVNFNWDDIVVSGGVLSNFRGSGSTYAVTYTPFANSTASGRISVASGRFSDAAGNLNADGADANNAINFSINSFPGYIFNSDSANNSYTGKAGIDTAVYSGNANQYTIQIDRVHGTAVVTDSQSGRDGSDTLTSIERLQFGNQTFELFNPARATAPKFGQTNSFLFDPSYYLLSNPGLAPSVTMDKAFDHYLSTGAAQGAKPNAWFDPVYYANRWDDLKALNLKADVLFQHYNLFGVWEGRSAGPAYDRYDGDRYLKDYPDVAAYVDGNVADFLGSRSNGAVAHYLIYGANEGRVAYDLDGNRIEQAILIGVAEV